MLLANADTARGQEAATRNCASCHTFEKGGAKKVGPNLYGVVGRTKAAVADFNYSTAMKSKGGIGRSTISITSSPIPAAWFPAPR